MRFFGLEVENKVSEIDVVFKYVYQVVLSHNQ